jgi:hypothetical protein
VLVDLGMEQPGGPVVWTEPQIITVLAGETNELPVQWAPPSPGEWRLHVRARLLEPALARGVELTSSQEILVRPAQAASLPQVVGAFGLTTPWQVALFGLILAGFGVAGSLLILRYFTMEPNQEEDLSS